SRGLCQDAAREPGHRHRWTWWRHADLPPEDLARPPSIEGRGRSLVGLVVRALADAAHCMATARLLLQGRAVLGDSFVRLVERHEHVAEELAGRRQRTRRHG